MKQFLLILLWFVFNPSDTLTGRVVRVIDGDTIIILLNGNIQERIRLADIDAPETGQEYSEQSRLYLSEMVAGKAVQIEYEERDIYGRILGTIFVDGKNVNEEMVHAGLAWEYKYNKNAKIRELQKEAQSRGINIWSSKNPIDPYDYRRIKK